MASGRAGQGEESREFLAPSGRGAPRRPAETEGPEHADPPGPPVRDRAPRRWAGPGLALLLLSLGLMPVLSLLMLDTAAALWMLPGDEALKDWFGLHVLAGLVALSLALWLVQSVLRALVLPLRGLSETLHRLTEGGEGASLAPPSLMPSEFGELHRRCDLLREAIRERALLGERVRWLANFDPLTGLPNRSLLRDRLGLAIAGCARDGTGLAVLALDIDHFKEVNDALGHGAGDAVLRQAAHRLRECLRAGDTLAHMGADEFTLVAPGLSDAPMLESLSARLFGAMAEPFEVGGERFTLGLSIGAAMGGAGIAAGCGLDDADGLLRDAELALERAKREGRGSLRLFAPDQDERLRARRALAADLGGAVRRGEFLLLFQPQVQAATGAVTGAEALLRWRHPTRGIVTPDLFIPLAEETGLIVPLGAWVLEEACRVAATWPQNLRIAVNVSAHQVRRASFVATVEAALARAGLSPSRLELEITEAVMLTHTAETVGTLSRLRDLGVRLAMDDFGTGYSSLATLQRFHFDKIKVDRAFVRNLARDERSVALLRAVVCMGSALGVSTNAEGVEEEGQLALLQSEGVDEAQGFLFGRPMPAQDFEARIAGRDGAPRDRAA